MGFYGPQGNGGGAGNVSGAGNVGTLAYFAGANNVDDVVGSVWNGAILTLPDTEAATLTAVDINGNGGTFTGDFTAMSFFGTDLVNRQAAVANAAGDVVVDIEARAALNSLLAKLRTLNLIAT